MPTSDDILNQTPPKADARIAYGPDEFQFIDLRLPNSKAPHALAICVHGGYWRAKYDLGYLGHLCATLTAQGLATANVEYRRVGNPGGGWPGSFADILAAHQFLAQRGRQYDFNSKRIVVIGHSAGGQLALCLASRESGIAAAIALAGVLDLQRAYELHLSNDAVVEFLGGTPKEVPDHYREADPMVLGISPKQYVLFGDEDEHVPPSQSKNYAAAKEKKGENVKLVEIPKAGHFELVDPHAVAFQKVKNAVLEAIA